MKNFAINLNYHKKKTAVGVGVSFIEYSERYKKDTEEIKWKSKVDRDESSCSCITNENLNCLLAPGDTSQTRVQHLHTYIHNIAYIRFLN